MRISGNCGGLVALYRNQMCAVKTRSDGFMYAESLVEGVLIEIEQIKRKA